MTDLICKEKASATDTSIIDSECNRYIERVQQIHTNYTYLYLLKLYLIEKKITIKQVKLDDFNIKKELIKSVMETERNPDITFETIKFIIDAEIVHK